MEPDPTPAAPSNAPGALLLAAAFALTGGLAGWWARGHLADEAALPSVAEPPVAVEAPAPLAPVAPAGPPDLVLVTVAALRVDHVGPLSGYDRPTMPFLSALASQKGQAFRAVAPSAWSLPSAVSLLTGVPPSWHGVLGRPRATEAGLEVPVLPDAIGTLAERLRRAGYRTRAVVADPALQRATGLGRGFQDFTNVGAARAQRVQGFVERIGLERRDAAEPLFLWVHYADPVAPYQANPWVFWWPDATGTTEADLLPLARMSAPELLPLVRGGVPGEAVGKLYDSELRLVDDHLQLLVGDLGLDDGDVLVVAGLHGEELAEHGGLGHGHALHEEVLRVPLVIAWPARWPQAQRIAEPVSLADLMPTLSELAGIPFRVEGKVPSRSLVPLIENRPRDPAPVVAELPRCRALYEGGLKLVDRGGEVAVFDLDLDPRTPLPPDHAGARALRGRLGPASVAPVGTATVDLAEAALAQLGATVPPPSACDP